MSDTPREIPVLESLDQLECKGCGRMMRLVFSEYLEPGTAVAICDDCISPLRPRGRYVSPDLDRLFPPPARLSWGLHA